MHEAHSLRWRHSHWWSICLALIALGLALRVRPIAWMLVLCLVPMAILVGAAPMALQIDRSHPRFTRLCGALSLLAYLCFIGGVALHVAHR